MAEIGDNSIAALIDNFRADWEETERIRTEGYNAAKSIVREVKKTVLHRQVTILGPQLLQFRKKPDGTQRSDEEFGKLVCDNFEFLSHTERHVRSAMMWAAEFPEEYAAIREEYPKCFSIRMLYQYHTNKQKEIKQQEEEQDKKPEAPEKPKEPKKPQEEPKKPQVEPTTGSDTDDKDDDVLIDPEAGGKPKQAPTLTDPTTLSTQAEQLPVLAAYLTDAFKGREDEFVELVISKVFEDEEYARLFAPALVAAKVTLIRAIDAVEARFKSTYPSKDRMI